MSEPTLSIKERAEATGVSAHTLRYYERVEILPPIPRASSGHRVYSEGHAEWVLFVKYLRATGMPIRRILHYTQLARLGDATVPERLQVLEDHRRSIERNLDELEACHQRITKKIAIYKEHIEQKRK